MRSLGFGVRSVKDKIKTEKGHITENLKHKESGLPANSDKPLQVLSTGTKYVKGSVRTR